MTVAGVERQSKVRQGNTVVDVTTLQANYDRLWLHVRVIYVLLAVLAACYLFTAYAIFGTHHRRFVESRPTATLDSRVAWQNLSSILGDGVTETGRPAMEAEHADRRRRSTWRHRRLARRLRSARAASDAGLPSSSWVSDDDSEHDGVWMTMQSKIQMSALQEFCATTKDYCPPGLPGPTGEKGERGEPGFDSHGPINGGRSAQGPPGAPGRDGLPGLPGSNGSDGERGRRGKPGVAGPPGEPGPRGPKGDKGDASTLLGGVSGRNCSCAKGDKGEPGEKGKRGLIGFIGYKGEQGDVGPPGPPGPVLEGLQGLPVAPGLPGLKGQKGEPGGSYGSSYVSGFNMMRSDELVTPPPDASTTSPVATISTSANEVSGLKPRQGCRLHKIGKPVFRRYTPVSWGAWMKESDAAVAGDDGQVWVMKHFTGSVVLQYDSFDEFVADRVSAVHELPQPFYGTGHVVYGAAIYYHRAGTDLVVRYDVARRQLTGSVRLYGTAHSGDDYLYSTGRSYVDLAADETGLWVIHAAAGDSARILVSRLDTEAMSVTSTWSIAVRHGDYGNGVVVCGVLYLVGDATARRGAPVDFAYDLYERRRVENDDKNEDDDEDSLMFSSPYQLTTALAYNPRDRRLYAWDNGNQLTYPLLV